MAKKIKTILKLQIPAGKANPAPPVGPALGQHGINIGDFVNRFNDATKEMGLVINLDSEDVPAASAARCNAAVPLETATAYLAPT